MFSVRVQGAELETLAVLDAVHVVPHVLDEPAEKIRQPKSAANSYRPSQSLGVGYVRKPVAERKRKPAST